MALNKIGNYHEIQAPSFIVAKVSGSPRANERTGGIKISLELSMGVLR
jgi:hypothetical protein